jgi:hypothetical protein
MLTDSNWDDFRTENPKMLTMFYAPWCGTKACVLTDTDRRTDSLPVYLTGGTPAYCSTVVWGAVPLEPELTANGGAVVSLPCRHWLRE